MLLTTQPYGLSLGMKVGNSTRPGKSQQSRDVTPTHAQNNSKTSASHQLQDPTQMLAGFTQKININSESDSVKT